MDLIDRSKLHSVSVVDSINSEGVVTVRSFWNSDVANAPTVEAIPIEWISKQIEKALTVDSVDMFYVRNLKYLIKTWEEENAAE